VVDNASSKFDLTMNVWEIGHALTYSFEYSTDLFKPETIQRMARHFETLVAGITADPDQRAFGPAVVDGRRTRAVAGLVERTDREYARDKCVHELIEAQAERTPDAQAVSFYGQQPFVPRA
jgi:non-ribosomal peptide synthetase component F